MGHRAWPSVEVLEAFGFGGGSSDLTTLSGGHIHDNYLVGSSQRRYVLQRLNERVFPDPVTVVTNGERVVTHLLEKGEPAPRVVPTVEGRSYFEEPGSVGGSPPSIWRAWTFLPGTENRARVQDRDDAFEAARVFGRFLVSMSDLPAREIEDTIPRFHDLRARVTALEHAAAVDDFSRRNAVRWELKSARELSERVGEGLGTRLESLPVRLVHNDAKVANVLFDSQTNRAVCVVDYDTVMAGNVLHDVGELVRTATTHAEEDSSDNGRVDFDLELLSAVAGGYLTETNELLSNEELESLSWAGPWMAVENGVRFLTDYLEGDRYFRTLRTDQNLDRCRAQLSLCSLMLESMRESRACFELATR